MKHTTEILRARASSLRAIGEMAASQGRQPEQSAQPAQSQPNGPAAKAQASMQALGELALQNAQMAAQEAQAARQYQEPQASQQPSQEGFPVKMCLAKNALNGGELSPMMGARYDQQRYGTGCHKLLNMIPMPTGGITKRPGLIDRGVAAQANPALPSRLIPFIFSASEARMLEFYAIDSNRCGMRVWMEDFTSRASGLTLPWKAAYLRDVCFCQSADVLYIAHAKLAPAKIMRYGDSDWRYAQIKWTPDIQPPANASLWLSNSNKNSRRITYYYKITSVDGETGEESAASREYSITSDSLSQDHFVLISIEPVAGASEYRVYKRDGGVFGFIGLVSEPGVDGSWIFEDKNIGADTADTPPNHKNPFAGGNYPAKVFLHQQRLGYAASDKNPQTVWLSPAGNYESMAASLPPADDDAIEATLAASQANRILWAESDRAGLIIGTDGGEWLLSASDGAALTPKNIGFEPQSAWGSQVGLAPLKAGGSLLFMQRGGRVARALAYSFQDDRYNAQDLSLLARHILADSPAKAWTWQPEPLGIVWLALTNGKLIGLTFLPEHEVIAWHRHETQGLVEDLASIPDPSGDWRLWALINRGGQRHIETLGAIGGTAPALDGPNRAEFQARCIPCIAEGDAQGQTTWLRLHKVNAVKARVINSMPFSVQAHSQYGQSSAIIAMPPRAVAGITQEADWSCPIGAGFREMTRIELIMDGKEPVTILGLTFTIEYANETGNQI